MNDPEQGGATGAPVLGDHIEYGHMYNVPNNANDLLEADLIRQVLIKKLGTASNPVLYHVGGGRILSDYSTSVL